jgi:alkylhydroperoxidase family enzyme
MTTPPTTTTTTPRVAALAPPYSGPVAAALERIMPAGVPPLALFRTLAVNERVFLRVMAGGLLDRGSIGLRDREIVIDRACARCGSEYEWGVHVALFAARVGLTPEQVAATRGDEATATAFPPRERLLLRLVDELHDGAQVSDDLWAALCREWSEEPHRAGRSHRLLSPDLVRDQRPQGSPRSLRRALPDGFARWSR